MAIPSLQGCGDLKGLANHLEPKADEAIIPTSNYAKKNEENVPIALETATHVYVKKENPKGLLQTYTGPHKIVNKPSHSTIKVKIGTFRWGVKNLQIYH